MKRAVVGLIAVAVTFFLPPSAMSAPDQPAYRVFLDVSRAPDAGETALKSSALVTEWYPKINEILYGPDHPLPFNAVFVLFIPDVKYIAYTSGNVIHVSSDYIKVMPDDFGAMLIHELTHVVQHYTIEQPEDGWVVEGMADYVRHKYFEKDIQATLRLNTSGQLYGYTDAEPFFYGLQKLGDSVDERGYLKSYTVASTFLFWLESHKDKQIVRELNLALSRGHYSADLFQQLCGKPLDDLWAEFVADSKAHKN